MPEGPEIRRAADRLASVLESRTLDDVYFGQPRLKRYEAALTGSTVTALETRGKALLTRLSNGLTLYSHNQLYGRWYVRPRGELPQTGRTLRVALHTPEHSALLYSASDIAVLDEAGLAAHPFLLRVGPDILDARLHWRDVAARLKGSRFRNRRLAALYLDQHFLAGVGNYLRSEILHDAQLSGQRRPADLTRGECGRLARSTLTISRRAYATGGLTNAPGRVRRLRTRGDARRAYRFAVFDRAGLPCYRCGDLIRRVNAGSRRLYFCPSCQPDPT